LRTDLRRLLLLLLRPAFAQSPGAIALISPESVAQNPDVRLDFDTSLDALAADWPLLKELSGAASMRVELAAGTAQGVTGLHRLVTVKCSDASFGKVPLGALELRLWTPAGSTSSQLSLDVRGPAAKGMHLEATLELEVDPGQARVSWRGPRAAGARGQISID
jgi:hypothetical protein